MNRPRRVLAPLLVVVALGAVMLIRRPDLLLDPKFYAEDGARWYGDAFNLGPWRAAEVLYGGYFQAYSRLIPALSLALPMRWAPRVFQLGALAAAIMPAAVLVSGRLRSLLPSFRIRVLLALFYAVLPNSYETDGNLTNAQSRLSLAAALLVLGEDPVGAPGRAADILLLGVSGLSGPFSIFLLPVAAAAWLVRRTRWALARCLLLGVTAAVQVVILLATGPGERSFTPLGATTGRLSLIVGGQVFVASEVGLHGLQRMAEWGAWSTPIAAAILLAGIVLVAIAVRLGPWQLRALVALAAASLAAALVTPLASDTQEQWAALSIPSVGNRYYLLPMVGWFASLAWLAARGPGTPRWIARALLLSAVVVAAPVDFIYPPYIDYRYSLYIDRYEALPNGGSLLVPINPEGWHLCLYKSPDGTKPPLSGRLPIRLKDLVGGSAHC